MNIIIPIDLAGSPSTLRLENLIPYNWIKQSRVSNDGKTFYGGDHTSDSVQTFDNNGNPKDSNSDKND